MSGWCTTDINKSTGTRYVDPLLPYFEDVSPLSEPSFVMHYFDTRDQWLNKLSELGQWHGCWCPGSLSRKGICSDSINLYAKYLKMPLSLIWKEINHVRPAWWRHQMEPFSALLAICAGSSPVPGEFPAQRPVTRSFDVSFDLHLNTGLSKQSRGWWFETPSSSLWRYRNVLQNYIKCKYIFKCH